MRSCVARGAHNGGPARFDNPELREWLINEGSQFVFKVQKHLASYDKDINPRMTPHEGRTRIALGVFSRVEGEEVKKNSERGGNEGNLERMLRRASTLPLVRRS